MHFTPTNPVQLASDASVIYITSEKSQPQDNKPLLDRTVAYINLDVVVAGTDVVDAMSSPLLRSLILDTLKAVQVMKN